MKCSEYIKSNGVKSLALLSEISGVETRTLQNWYTDRKFVFDSVLEKVAENINKLPESTFERVSKTFGDDGYYYGLLKEDKPYLPELQLKIVCYFLEMDYEWGKEERGSIFLNRLDPMNYKTICIDSNGKVLAIRENINT